MHGNWVVEQASNEEPNVLASLLFATAPILLSNILSNGDQSKVREYLSYSLTQKDGQYGYGNHYVVRDDSHIIGIGSAWHDALPVGFDQATLNSIHHFFGIDDCIQILHRSSALSFEIPKPTSKQLIIGHLSTSPKYQRRGIATALIVHFIHQARQLGKTEVVVDVEKDNRVAQNCYQKLGFLPLKDKVSNQFIRLLKAC